MAQLRSLPEGATLPDVYAAFAEPMLHLTDFAESLMRGPSPLSEGERELIAAYVSGLNGCAYCLGIHAATAEAFGLDRGLFESLMDDLDAAPIDGRLRPLLHYVRKLTETPHRLVPADAEAVYAAGWDDQALFHAIAVCAYFNLMNRIVDGTGCSADQSFKDEAGRRLASVGYAAMRRLVADRKGAGD